MGKVLIKCIQTPMQKYFYDRSLDSVVMVNDEEYQILKTVEKTKLVPDGVLRRFVKSGLLRETAIEEIEHPETENLHLLAEHYMGNLILQVTQQCNLRCKYCAYSGNYYNRSHTSNRMDFETAKKAIDFYLKRSEKADQLALSFYGGEPLLEFELIKKCVSYILQRKGDKKILFTMTTNGTLMTEDVIEFFKPLVAEAELFTQLPQNQSVDLSDMLSIVLCELSLYLHVHSLFLGSGHYGSEHPFSGFLYFHERVLP